MICWLKLAVLRSNYRRRDIGPRSNGKNLRRGLETKNKWSPYPLVVKTWPVTARTVAGILLRWRVVQMDGCRANAMMRGLKGIVSKKLNAPYRSGPSRIWIRSRIRRHLRQRG